MEKEQAAEVLKKMKLKKTIFSANGKELERNIALQIGIGAIRRMIAETPEIEKDENGDSIFRCPDCKEEIKAEYVRIIPFCCNKTCGKALRW